MFRLLQKEDTSSITAHRMNVSDEPAGHVNLSVEATNKVLKSYSNISRNSSRLRITRKPESHSYYLL